VTRLAAAAAAMFIALLSLSVPAGAQESDAITTIAVIEVSGLLDPVEVAYIETQLATAEEVGATVLVLQVNSSGHAVPDARMIELLDRLEGSPVPIAVWVGQAGGRAYGGAAHFVSIAALSAISPGSQIGDFGTLDRPLDSRYAAGENTRFDDTTAVTEGMVDLLSPTIGDFLLALEDQGVIPVISEQVTNADGVTIQRQLAPDVQVQFGKLSIVDQLFHTAASPAVAYLMLVIGLALILLDFFTGGVGVAGVVGAFCVLMAAYGLYVLDTRTWAIVLLVISPIAFGVDLQTGVPRFWTGVGLVTLVVGSFALYDGHDLSWLALLVGVGLTASFMFSGMPALIRTRYGTSTLGREWMIGEMGEAVSDIDPDGMVLVRGAQWRARVNRLTPLSAGDSARVVALDGLVLEVEPEEGGAIDYREMRKSND
jgi:membrane-bound serine protease (ClpP class)